MKLSRLVTIPLVVPLAAVAQIIDSPDGEVAGIPAIYTEAKAGWFELPDPLVCEDGTPVTDVASWREKRRPEVLGLVESNQYGRVPPAPDALKFERFDEGTPAFDGTARRKQVTITFDEEGEHFLDLLVYLPAGSEGDCPILLNIGWIANNLAVDDPGVKVGRQWNREEQRREPATKGGPFGKLGMIPMALERGYGVAHFNYADIEPDDRNGFTHGIRRHFLEEGRSEPGPGDWGAIAAWGWGISRVIDYFETDPDIDASRVAITGVSRLGKTVLWAGARDERVACVLASVSGSGGASLNRRRYGERPAHLVARFPYWFAPKFASWVGREEESPWDSHFILSLIAPRAVLLQTGSTDKWSDPYGELVAARAATPVFHLFDRKGIEDYPQPPLGEPVMNRLGYLMHDGGHGMVPGDWPVFLDFMARPL